MSNYFLFQKDTTIEAKVVEVVTAVVEVMVDIDPDLEVIATLVVTLYH